MFLALRSVVEKAGMAYKGMASFPLGASEEGLDFEGRILQSNLTAWMMTVQAKMD